MSLYKRIPLSITTVTKGLMSILRLGIEYIDVHLTSSCVARGLISRKPAPSVGRSRASMQGLSGAGLAATGQHVRLPHEHRCRHVSQEGLRDPRHRRHLESAAAAATNRNAEIGLVGGDWRSGQQTDAPPRWGRPVTAARTWRPAPCFQGPLARC
ncbi:hypothetical protein VUR80DRAFT_10347 [Thermomyces stellatus]